MTAPRLLSAARHAADRDSRIRLMATVMIEHGAGADGGCTFQHLGAAGFTAAEIEIYRDPARALISGRAPACSTIGARRPGGALVRAAKRTRIKDQDQQGAHG